MFSSILQRHRRQNHGAAYATWTEEAARQGATREAVDCLYAYLDGQERAAAVREALRCLVAVHGDPLRAPAREIWRALDLEDEEARFAIIDPAFRVITDWLRRAPLRAAVAGRC
jgi:hypothetical protein